MHADVDAEVLMC